MRQIGVSRLRRYEVAHVDAQRVGELFQHLRRHVAFAEFHVGYLRAADADAAGQFFLGHALRFAGGEDHGAYRGRRDGQLA